MAKTARKPQSGAGGRPQSGADKHSPRKGETRQPVKQTKKQIALGRKEARQLRIIWISLGALGLVILFILGFALVSEAVVKPSRPVAIVNGARISIKSYEGLLTYYRYNLHQNINQIDQVLNSLDPSDEASQFMRSFYEQQAQQFQTYLNTVSDIVMDELIEDALIREKAQEAGILVTGSEVTQAINDMINEQAQYAAQSTITDTAQIPTPTPLPQAEVDKIYNDMLANMKLSDKQFREVVEINLLRQKVQELLAGQVLTTGLVAHVQMVRADSQEEADSALKRIESGEDFAIVAQEVSTDTQTAETGGDLGWVASGQLSSRYGEEVDAALFSMEVGTARVVESNGQFYLIRVVERNENGPLPDEVISARRNSALEDWLTARKAAPDVQIERLLQPEQIPADPFAQSPGG